MSTFGERIAELRKSKNMTQETLSRKLNVTAQAVSKWERDESMPDVSLIPCLAEILDVTTDTLFGIEKKSVVEYRGTNEKSFEKTVLKINMKSGGDNIKLNIPLPLLKTMNATEGITNLLNNGTHIPPFGFDTLIQMIECGADGKLIDINDDDGSSIVIEVV